MPLAQNNSGGKFSGEPVGGCNCARAIPVFLLAGHHGFAACSGNFLLTEWFTEDMQDFQRTRN